MADGIVRHPDPILEILLPVYNEGHSIEGTLREIYGELAPRVPLRFIACEDGSTDNSREVLLRLSASLPIRLITSEERKGYSRAVVDGMTASTAPYLLCLDSDGQCDPKDFWQFWDLRDSCDVLLGWRVRRADSAMRLLMSGAFHQFYRLLYRVPVHDPSCPYVLMRKHVVQRIAPEMGEMRQGFWWEFVARVHRRGFAIKELPVRHRPRAAGVTQVYRLRKLPGIGYRHFVALFKIWWQTRS
jgi:glycosyltransferase involved in cell wall biosynthesis